MTIKLFSISALLFSSLYTHKIQAQEYQPIGIQSGFNADVIANGVGTATASTTHDIDGVNYAFVSKDYQLTSESPLLTYGLPLNGIINSEVSSTNGLSYQLAPYNGNNALRLSNTDLSGTLMFSTPISAVTLYMLATGGSGTATVDAIINFSDATAQTVTGIEISDWYNSSNYATSGIGRINLNNNNLESGNGTNPRIYQIPLSIDPSNQSKSIQSITLSKTSTSNSIPNIFAFSGDLYNSCGAPEQINASTTAVSANISWTNPTSGIPSSGYEYYYDTSSSQPTASTVPTGTVPTGENSVIITGLTTGQTYYFWVRSNCGSNKGFWKKTQFTTGQISATYTLGDINTQYTEEDPTTTSANTCPGNITIEIPAGYKIASTDVSYTMTAQSSAWISDQRSILVCTTNNATEDEVYSGSEIDSGTFSYERTGLTLANNLTGNVSFELRSWRTYGYQDEDCDTFHNKVDNNSWKITVTLEPLNLSTIQAQSEKKLLVYPVPFREIIHLDSAKDIATVIVNDLSGKKIKTIEHPSSVLNLSELKPGVYILNMTMKDGSNKSARIIKN